MPIYNGENELNRSIESVLSLTYENIQLILIDDGSTDSSYEICNQFKQQDKRIELFRTENCGVSSSRNLGLNHVRGEYVTFLDADDAMKDTAVATMVKSLEETDSDMVVCSYYKEFNNNIHVSVEKLEKQGRYTVEEYLCNTLKDPGHHYYGVVWNKLYKSAIIQNNKIRFDSDVNLGEDFIFNLEYLSCSRNVNVIRDKLIIYNKVNAKTLSQNKSKSLSDCKWELKNRKHIYNRYVDVFKKANLYNKYIDKINFYWIIFYIRQVHDTNKEYNWDATQKREWINCIENDDYIRQSLQIVPNKKIKRYRRWYSNNYAIKKFVKQLGGIK